MVKTREEATRHSTLILLAVANLSRYNKVQRLFFKLHLTRSNLTNRNIFKCFKLKRVFPVDGFFPRKKKLLFHRIVVAIFVDLHYRSNGCWRFLDLTWLASAIRNEIIYFLTRCNWWISIKSTSMRRNVNELTENCLCQRNRTGLTQFSLGLAQRGQTRLQFHAIVDSFKPIWWEREIDMLVTANEPIIVIQLNINKKTTTNLISNIGISNDVKMS